MIKSEVNLQFKTVIAAKVAKLKKAPHENVSRKEMLSVINSIDSTKFAQRCFFAANIKPSSSARYLRMLKAESRRRLG